jgi:hypothetical protein
MPERHLAGRPVDEDAAADGLVRPLGDVRDRHHRLDAERLAGHRGDGDRRAGVARQP